MTLTIIGLFIFLLGLCIGSFLNVVVYRLPRNLSVAGPRWSFCPHCNHQLAWYDNLPLVGWFLLAGRCRYCRTPISVQYPLVEALTGLAFALVWYLLAVANARAGFDAAALPLDPALFAILAAWLALAAGLLACAALDIVSYLIDTRITNAVVLLGVLAYLCTDLPTPFVATTIQPWYPALAAAFLVGAATFLLSDWLTARRPDDTESDPADTHRDEAPPAATAPPSAPRLLPACAALLIAALALLCVLIPILPLADDSPLRTWIAPAALALLFLTMTIASSQPRAADDELEAAIEEESPSARREILRDLLWLLPSIAVGLAVFFLIPTLGTLAAQVTLGPFQPLTGLIYSLGGAALAAAAGWIVRIVFTIIFGREAFGTGDIFILAAAGAAGGPDIALLGFFISIPIALLSWLASLLLKRSVMIAFGPPLALGFLTALWLNKPALDKANYYADQLTSAWHTQRSLVVMLIGIMLVGSGAAILLAKLVRRLIEPSNEPDSPPSDTPQT